MKRTTPSRRQVKLETSSVPELPAGSVVDLSSVPLEQLAFGDLVCAMRNRKPMVGRFLDARWEVMEVAMQGRRVLVPATDLVGRVTLAQCNGRPFDPNRENLFWKALNRLTWYGTRLSPME